MQKSIFEKKTYIVGAHSRGITMGYYLNYLYPSAKILAYLINNDEPNPKTVNNIPVLYLGNNGELDTSAIVYIGTRSIYHNQLKHELMENGFPVENIIPVTVDLDIELRNQFVRKHFVELGKVFVKFEELEKPIQFVRERTASIYQAGSAFDAELKDSYTPLPEEKMLQVGAALSEKRLYDGVLTDSVGNNISEKNKQFCELTGLYWIWKNAPEDIVGLVHYRRHFLLPENWVEVFDQNRVDVILPVPLYVVPSVADNYRERHVASDWDFMMEYLWEHHEDDYEKAKTFFQDGLYSPCNMLITRKEVMNELCEWLFPIIFAVAEHGGIREDKYQNRYPGFISERLITYYFESRRDRYKIVYCDKNFLA